MGPLYDSVWVAFGAVVAATFVMWFGVAHRRLRSVAAMLLGLGALVFALLAFYAGFAGGTWAVFFLASTALANLGGVLHKGIRHAFSREVTNLDEVSAGPRTALGAGGRGAGGIPGE